MIFYSHLIEELADFLKREFMQRVQMLFNVFDIQSQEPLDDEFALLLLLGVVYGDKVVEAIEY